MFAAERAVNVSLIRVLTAAFFPAAEVFAAVAIPADEESATKDAITGNGRIQTNAKSVHT